MERPVERALSSLHAQLIWPDETLTKAVRLAATVDIYRGLTGDMTTPGQALADHALLVAKKRDFAHNTPVPASADGSPSHHRTATRERARRDRLRVRHHAG